MSGRTSLKLLSLTALALCTSGSLAQDAGTVARGKAVFAKSCAPCHGAERGDFGRAMLPGTDALRIKYKGTLPALLEQRTDLTTDAIRVFVRRGTWSMPPLRKTEISDEEIAAVSAYIADAAKKPR
ncbi:MAG: cytochrome c [Steroidobacteraceae bacterium]